jgi:predicted site-specific integrase-resolvase
MIPAQQAAQMLGVSVSTLYRFVERGLIKRQEGNPLLKRQPMLVSRADVEKLLHDAGRA